MADRQNSLPRPEEVLFPLVVSPVSLREASTDGTTAHVLLWIQVYGLPRRFAESDLGVKTCEQYIHTAKRSAHGRLTPGTSNSVRGFNINPTRGGLTPLGVDIFLPPLAGVKSSGAPTSTAATARPVPAMRAAAVACPSYGGWTRSASWSMPRSGRK